LCSYNNNGIYTLKITAGDDTKNIFRKIHDNWEIKNKMNSIPRHYSNYVIHIQYSCFEDINVSSRTRKISKDFILIAYLVYNFVY